MARQIDKLPKRFHPGMKPTYPWHQWLNGKPWVILYGEDYKCTHEGMRVNLYRAARQRNGIVETRALREDGERVGWAFQFIPLEKPRALRAAG